MSGEIVKSASGTEDEFNGPRIIIVMPVTVRAFAEATRIKPFRIIADLMETGVLPTMTQTLTREAVLALGTRHRLRLEIIDEQ